MLRYATEGAGAEQGPLMDSVGERLEGKGKPCLQAVRRGGGGCKYEVWLLSLSFVFYMYVTHLCANTCTYSHTISFLVKYQK